MVSTIEQQVKQGKLVQQILTLVKEDVLVDRAMEDLEESIIKITNLICYANNITEKQRFENAQVYTISCHEDAILLPLITAIELSSLQCRETVSISTTTMKPSEPNISNAEPPCAKRTSIEEGKALNIRTHQDYSLYKEIPKLEGETGHTTASQTVSELEETKV